MGNTSKISSMLIVRSPGFSSAFRAEPLRRVLLIFTKFQFVSTDFVLFTKFVVGGQAGGLPLVVIINIGLLSY
jgi:hypothetical protein